MSENFTGKKVIINCEFCSSQLRVPLFAKDKLTIICPRCGRQFKFDCKKYRLKAKYKTIALNGLFGLLVVLSVASPVYGLYLVKSQSRRLLDANKARISDYKANMEDVIVSTKNDYLKEIEGTSIKALMASASENYERIWQERNNYNTKYALSDREKAQLKMISLARGGGGNIDSIIYNIAEMALPKNSEIYVDRAYGGKIALLVSFHMEDITKGEKGTRTKHQTIKSLKNEAIKLSSKVTNDVYTACKDLDLDEIYVGCKHLVTTTYEGGVAGPDEDRVLFEVKVIRDDTRELTHNPFLDIYSVTQYMRIVEDNFSSLRIVDR